MMYRCQTTAPHHEICVCQHAQHDMLAATMPSTQAAQPNTTKCTKKMPKACQDHHRLSNIMYTHQHF